MSVGSNEAAVPPHGVTNSPQTGASPLSTLHLLDAFRRSDERAVQAIVSQMDTSRPLPQSDSPLHLAVLCAQPALVEFALFQLQLSPSMPASDTGNTPLHLAIAANRLEVAALLVSQPTVDCAFLNKEGRSPVQLVKSMEMANMLQHQRNELRTHILRLLDAYDAKAARGETGSQEEQTLINTVSMPRTTAIELESVEPRTSLTPLQMAVKYKSTELIKACVAKGCDPYVKGANGCSANDMTNDKMIQALLRQLVHAEASTADNVRHTTSYRGFLGKWTNYMHGFKTRWFVLSDGVLSYYRTPDDEGRQVRGALNLRNLKIVPDRRERNRFEIVSDTSKGSTRWFLRSDDPSECVRWIQVLEKAQRNLTQDASASTNAGTDTDAAPSDTAGATLMPAAVGSNVPGQGRRSSAVNAEIVEPSSVAMQDITPDSLEDAESDAGSVDGVVAGTNYMPHSKDFTMVNNLMSLHFDVALRLIDQIEGESGSGAQPASAVSTVAPTIPGAALNGTDQRVVIPPVERGAPAQPIVGAGLAGVPTVQSGIPVTPSSPKSTAISTLRESLQERFQLWKQYSRMVQEREAYLQEEIERLDRTRHLWEEQVTVLAAQHKELESNLHEAVSENTQMLKGLRQVSQKGALSEEPGSIGDKEPTSSSGISGALGSVVSTVGETAGASAGAATHWISQLLPQKKQEQPSSSSIDDYDDEFFDTIDSDQIPNLRVEPALESAAKENEARASGAERLQEGREVGTSAATGAGAAAGAAGAAGASDSKTDGEEETNNSKDDGKASEDQGSQVAHRSGSEAMFGREFEPYNHLRDRLPVRNDERPSMSLWSILKNNIGKDLTKISFPVAFNEPTSMLQRMSEDLEFSECLDAAALQSESTRRILYVAAFAMSNYSSTINRIAKPFNPLLGETFEYVRPDRQYRYISEQVSHHPPISACFCESPSWEYMGCVDAKSKFLGRSFEIRPTGVAHAKIKVKSDVVPSSMRDKLQQSPDDESLLMEHYSWNKVITSVSGFITGSPTIDHYGDMVVVNHVTGDKCKLTFKPRGWRSNNSYEINGEVIDGHGKKVWIIAGRWNSQLIATRCHSEDCGVLSPDKKHDSSNPVDSSKADHEYLLLWRNSKKVPTPFNLTPFAITLNSRPDGLLKWLPPTDCRLRPDLTAFENGKFDQADQLKVQLENLQREKRRQREEGRLPPHKPRWFKRTVDPDSNESFWQPLMSSDSHGRETMSYWVERSEVGTKREHNQPAEWNTDHIFGDLEAKGV